MTGSEGRRALVKRAGLPWLPMNSNFDEDGAAGKFDRAAIGSVRRAADYCAYLSAAKNVNACGYLKNAAVITADTAVFYKKLLEKPRGENGVYEMLGGLNDNPHEVITAVTIGGLKGKRLPNGLSKFGNEIINYYMNEAMGVAYVTDVFPEEGENGAFITFTAVSRVLLSGVTRELIKRTIEEENPFACSGGYTIDGLLKPYFKILSGTEENIIGLPLSEILEVLLK